MRGTRRHLVGSRTESRAPLPACRVLLPLVIPKEIREVLGLQDGDDADAEKGLRGGRASSPFAAADYLKRHLNARR
jgi:hypothetical protein